MIVGEIIECGDDVTEYQIGDSVCCYGPLQETVIVNAVNNYKLRKMPQGASWKNAVCYDPAQFAMSGVRDANVRVGDFVVVVGLGAIGQIAIQLAKKPVRQWLSALIQSNIAVRSPVVTVRTTA